MNLNKEDIIHKSTNNIINQISCSNIGFMPTNKDFCIINMFNIIRHIESIFEELSIKQKENAINAYNTITLRL